MATSAAPTTQHVPGSQPITARNKTEEILLQALHRRVFEGKRVSEMIPGRASPHVYRTLDRWVAAGRVTYQPWSYRGRSEWDRYQLVADHIDLDRIATDLRMIIEDAWTQRMDGEATRAHVRAQIEELRERLLEEIPADDAYACDQMHNAAYDHLRAWSQMRSAQHQVENARTIDATARVEARRWGLDPDRIMAGANDVGGEQAENDPLGGDA